MCADVLTQFYAF